MTGNIKAIEFLLNGLSRQAVTEQIKLAKERICNAL